jgi:hypothetical protein
VPRAQQPARARAQQPLGVSHGGSVPAQLALEQLDPAECFAEPGLVADEIVADHKELLTQPQVLFDQAITTVLVMRVAFVWRTLFVRALIATELGVLHARRG